MVAAFSRTRVEALREIKQMVADAQPAVEILGVVEQAIEGIPRDTSFDVALVLLTRCHAALKRSTRPRPDHALLREVGDLLGGVGIEVRDG